MTVNPKKLLLPGIVCLAFLLGAALSRYGRAAETQQIIDGTPTQVLVQEIRSLRQALQSLATNNIRLQTAIERSRSQQLAVDRLTDEYNAIQAQIESNDDLTMQMESNAKNIERFLNAEPDSVRRAETEREYKNTLTNIEQSRLRTQKLQERLMQVNSTLQVEKTKQNELKDALDSLDRSLANQQVERK